MGLAICQFIRQAHWNNECQNFIVYGPLGYGKTSYSIQALMEIYKTEDPAILEKYFAFTPAEFLKMIRSFDRQVPTVAWDDAGIWLYYMDYSHPVVKRISKMMQMIRTRTASVIFTTPMPTLILGKLRNFPQTLTIKIKKRDDAQRPYARRATAYRSWLLPDLQKIRIKKAFLDDFSVMLPQDVYEWFNKKREGYVKLLEEGLDRDLQKEIKLPYST